MNLVTSKIPGEGKRQYAAWLLYSEAGSLKKTLRIWERIRLQNDTEVMPVLEDSLGKLVSIATLKRWSSRYHWKERTELKNTEDLEDIKLELRKIKQRSVYKIAILFDRILDKCLRQLDGGMNVTVNDLYLSWKMFRVEQGLSVGKYEIVIDKQPPVDIKTSNFNKRVRKLMDKHESTNKD